MINSHKQKGDTSNEKIKLVGVTLALFCTLSMAACGSTQNGQETQSEPPAYSQGEMSGGNKDADAGKGKEELPGNLGDIEAEAILGGSVAEFQDGSFQVVPMEADAETVKSAASGMESTLESTTVSYGDDCTFHIANINRTTGAVEFEAATSSDVKNLHPFISMEKHRMMEPSMLPKYCFPDISKGGFEDAFL